MPMDTQMFHNDFVWGIIVATMPFVFMAVVKLSPIIVSTIGDVKYESLIQSQLQRAGMRKSVELYVDVTLTLLVSLILMPPLVYMTL
mgnify:FL=1